MSYIDNYTAEEIELIVKNSVSYKDFARKIGYSNTPSGDTIKMIKNKLLEYDTSHFISNSQNNIQIKRIPENTFIQNSTASQSTVRRLYLENNYTPYICSICGQEPIWQEKELTLILDHINGINNDDRLENLPWVCPNCNQQLDTTGPTNPNRKNFAKKYYCIDCGKEISKTSIRCMSCEAKHKTISLTEMPVTRDELKDLIRTKPFTQIGVQFNVTDNAIRKWCDKFNLPRKKSDIQKYSDEEWLKI